MSEAVNRCELAQVSALTGEGVAELRACAAGAGARGCANDAEGGMLTSLRHYEALQGCTQALARARVRWPSGCRMRCCCWTYTRRCSSSISSPARRRRTIF